MKLRLIFILIVIVNSVSGYEYPKRTLPGNTTLAKKGDRINKGLDNMLNHVTNQLAKQKKGSKSFKCCRGMNYSKCIERKLSTCFSDKEAVELKCQHVINKICNMSHITSSGQNNRGGDATMATGKVLQNCLKSDRLPKACKKSLKIKIKGLAKSKSRQNRKKTNVSRKN